MIEKITDHNLERYDSRLKEWCDRKFFEKGNYGKYETTEEAGAVAFYPAPDTPLEGKVKFSFNETPPASGDKSPSNPSTITGVQEVKLFHSNSNMLYFPYYDSQRNYGSGALTMTANADGSVSVSGKYSSNGTLRLFATYPGSLGLPVKDGLTYYNTSKGDTYQPQLRFYNDKTTNVAKFVSAGSSWLYNLGDSTTTVAIVYPANLDLTATTAIIFPSLSIVPYDGPWEQPETVVHNVDLGSTYYGGEIDLATGLMTVTWYGEYVSTITNTELASNYVRATLAVTYGHMGSGSALAYFRSNYDDDGTYVYPRYSAGTARISISFPYEMLGLDPSTATVETARTAVESFLAQHPCFVVYRLYTPQTVQLSPMQIYSLTQADKYTPRLNTVYTDADSVQIFYLKSPIRDEYEKTQAILSLGGNS